MIKFDDARALSEGERRRLARLMYLAFCEVRALTIKGDCFQQAHDLADVFHNVPLHLYRDDFSISFFLARLEDYQRKHDGGLKMNYLKEWEKPDVAYDNA